MSFFKHGEAWLKDAINKVETQLDKAFEIPKESSSTSLLTRSSRASNESFAENNTDGDSKKSQISHQSSASSVSKEVHKSTVYLGVDGDFIPSASLQTPFSPQSHPLKSSNLNPTALNLIRNSDSASLRSDFIDPANIPLPPDSPPLINKNPVPFKKSSAEIYSSANESGHIDKSILAVVSVKDDQIRSLLQENELMQTDLSRSRETIKKLLAKVQNLESKLRENVKHSRDPLGIKHEEFKALEIELAHWKTLAREMELKQQGSSTSNPETDSFRVALELEVKKSLELQGLLKSLKDELNAYRLQMEQSYSNVSAKEAEYQDIEAQLRTEVDRYRAQVLEIQKNFDNNFQKTTLALTKQLQEAELTLKSTEEAHVLREEKLASQAAKAKNDAKDLQSRLDNLNVDYLRQMEIYRALELKYNQLQEDHQILMTENEKQKKSYESLEFEYLSKSSSEDLIAAASQTDISALAGSNNSIFLAISEPMKDSVSDNDSISSKESSQLSIDRLQASSSSVSSRRLSMDISHSSIHLVGSLKTQFAVLQTSKEQLTSQVVLLNNENMLLKSQIDDLQRENHQLNSDYHTVLELLGEKEEEIADCRLCLKEAKEVFREQLESLMSNFEKK